MKIRYFSWIRETIGEAEESFPKPKKVNTVHDLLEHLSHTSDNHATALKERVFIKVAVNQVHADHNSAIADNDEIAIFPPVTGG